MRKTLFFLASALAIASCSDIGGFSGDGGRRIFAGNPPAAFSEIYLANADYEDEYGEKPGWVEFYNPADAIANLSGYSLTNNANEILWTFGNTAVLPRSYLTVFFSGRNKPDLNPPSDSVDLIKSALSAGSWADSQYNPPGGSTAQYSFSKSSGIISGRLFTKNNPVLGWSSASVTLRFNAIDISKTNQILLRGNLDKDSKLEIRLAQQGTEEHLGWPAIIKGTGIPNDLYIIELPTNPAVQDLKKIVTLRFASVANDYGTINFSFNSIVAQKRGNDIHVSFKLDAGGGQLFLMDSKRQIRDSVSYPAETRDLSFAKNFESGRWMLSKPPTPNLPNSNELYEEQAQMPANAGIPPSGYYGNSLYFVLPEETEHGAIRCDTSGALPSAQSALKAGSAISLAKPAVMRCAQFKDGAYPSEPVMRTYIIGERPPALPVVSIAVNPKDMFDPTVGIYSKGPNASSEMPYYGANYWQDIELPVQVDFFENGARHAWSHSAGIKIFGNYSRTHNKKSVAIGFKGKYGAKKLDYPLFPEHPHLTKFNWFLLRNNGNNFGRDYIRDMLMTSLTEGLGVDYQKGRSVIVYYNGKYYGIHNLRERSNKDYFETNYGISEGFLDLAEANNQASSGSDANYQEILNWVGKVAMSDENLSSLEKLIDLDNYTNYLQSEIYFVNKDWPGNNLKRWRSNQLFSKWKWFMYDTDFGFRSTNDKPEVKMLDFVTEVNNLDWPNPQHSTLLTRKLFQNSNYKNAFINRFSLLLATYYAPARVESRINYLMNAIESEISSDQQRWGLNKNTMNNELSTIKTFGRNRASEMQTEIGQYFKLGKEYNFTLSANGSGKILVHNLPVLNGSATFTAYQYIPVKIKAVPTGGAKFTGWNDGVKDAERTVLLNQSMSLMANFM